MSSPLSFVSTESFRNNLLVKNLQPYSVSGVFSPQSNVVQETNLSFYNVVDSPNDLVSTNQLANTFYPLNEYGPDGGFLNPISLNNLLPVDPNQGPYDYNDNNLVLANEFFIDSAYVQNSFGPEDGFKDLFIVTTNLNPNQYFLPYPQVFVNSVYSTFSMIFQDNPQGSNGLLSQDSYLARLASQQLRESFNERIAFETRQATIGRINLDTLQDPFSAAMLATGKQPFFEKNWKITVPESPILASVSLANRITGTYFPVSFIPGDYFSDPDPVQNPQVESALNVVNGITGGFLGPILNRYRNPSETFVQNTGNGQRSVLFKSLDYNVYRPSYNRGLIQGLTTLVGRLLDEDRPNTGGYYVGSENAEPSQITSPANQVPVDRFGKQTQSLVYGPSELGILYEGNENKINFGLQGKSYSNEGGITGQLVWTSPKYKGDAGFKVGKNGKKGELDPGFESLTTQYNQYQSTEIEFKGGSILDNTQRLIDSADNVSGIARLKHVGNAINQVSKVFNDGYKELTKGSQVLSYTNDTTGAEEGIEYCRVFTKDTPYFTYDDLQKTDGITNSGRRFSYSVLDNTYNLNIAPLKNPGSTNIVDNKVKKYMFSIENLAWRTSDKPGYTVSELPVCEQGPNGGRIMWFPPYDLTFSDDSKPDFSQTNFLGRPEPIYTYKNTSRSGTISWKIVVDHPAVMNTIITKQLSNVSKERVDSIMDSFFAGCVKYDIYELAAKFNQIPISELFTYQEILRNPRLTDEELQSVAVEIKPDPVINILIKENAEGTSGTDQNGVGGNGTITEATTTDKDVSSDFNEIIDLGFYFDNNCPICKNDTGTDGQQPYNNWYDLYVGKKQTYIDNAPYKVQTDKSYSGSAVSDFFTKVVEANFTKIKDVLISKITKVVSEQKGTFEMKLTASASSPATETYNVNIAKRRDDAVKRWFRLQKIGEKTFEEWEKDGKIKFLESNIKGEEVVIPKAIDATLTPDPNNPELNDVIPPQQDVDCRKTIVSYDSNGVKLSSQSAGKKYSIPAMACRRVAISEIKAVVKEEVKPPEVVEPNKEPEITVENPQPTTQPIKPLPTKTIEQKIKDGISKKILRSLFSECDYFEVIQKENPMIYDSIRDKIKYFNPTFHSTTPEGLNARLTFLNQCVRPGQSIPVIGTDGRPKEGDALNTAFGTPPVLVLRIGDFYHTKIIPTSVGFSYDPLIYDMNPEGIGVQPMIVKVTLSFNFIGGHGLKEPIDQLQNALSFNYYANTEVYDERATATEDVSALDKLVVNKILENQKNLTTNDVVNQEPKKGGETIGTIIDGVSAGTISYDTILTKLNQQLVEYFKIVPNSLSTIQKTTNYGIVQLTNKQRNYIDGVISEFTTLGNVTTGDNQPPRPTKIYGKPDSFEKFVDNLVNEVIKDTKDNKDPITSQINSDPSINKKVLREVTDKLVEKVSTRKEFLKSIITQNINAIIKIEEDLIYSLRKVDVVMTKLDGVLTQNNEPQCYDLSGDTFFGFQKKLDTEYRIGVTNILTEFYDFISANILKPSQFSEETSTVEYYNSIFPNNLPYNRFYLSMSDYFLDDSKYNLFVTDLTNGNEVKSQNLENKIKQICDIEREKYKNIHTNEINDTDTLLFNNENYQRYLNFDIKIPDFTTSNVVNYITPPTDNLISKNNLIKNLYSNVNLNNDKKTFNGKIKLN
jgi:hypothetical protein